MSATYGYIRVSSTDQNEVRQQIAMEKQAVPAECIYMDKQSGKDFQRPQYQKLLEFLQPGDLLYITSIDRLGRNYKEIQTQWRILTHEKQVDIAVLDMPLLDTRREKNLLGIFIADLVLQVLSFVAQNERENIRKRQAEGIAVARKKGIYLGRKAKPLPAHFSSLVERWKQGEISAAQAARLCHMARSTFRYQAQLLKKETGK